MGIFVFIIFPYQASALMSKDGVIQNVQTYSSNPFWQMGTNSYNQRMPTAIYATGTAIETSECQSIVATLIATQCAMRNNCISTQLSEIRPTIMLQLSRIPNGNYATACGGYIDTAFDTYIKTRANAAPTTQTTFPTATTPNPTATAPMPALKNPYNPSIPDWQSDIMERKLELQELQSANGAGNTGLERAAFPTSASDLSYEQRIENAAAGYEPYNNKSAFTQITIAAPKETEKDSATSSQKNNTKIVLRYLVKE